MADVLQAIQDAEALLPGQAAPEGENDPRWQAIIRVAEFIKAEPEPIWAFVVRWASSADDDLVQALSKVVLEHLLEYHFATYFPRVERQALLDRGFARVFCSSGQFGQSEAAGNAARFEALKHRLGCAV